MTHGSQRHALEEEYQLDSLDLMEAIRKRPRLQFALEGAVAEELNRKWIAVDDDPEYVADSVLRFQKPYAQTGAAETGREIKNA